MLLYAVCAGIFAVVFLFYNLPLEPVLYALVLSIVVILAVMVPDYLKFARKHQKLTDMQKHVQISIEQLPEPENLIESDYQQQLNRLFSFKCEAESQFDGKYQDMMDYYTMWAHQIKTPISAMRLILQAQPSQCSGELLEQLFKIEQYVEMVLQYMRMENTGNDLVIRQHSLDKIIRQAVHKYAKSFIRKKIRLQYCELNCAVVTDEKWLVFVAEQIISNALKYTKTGEVSIYMDPEKEKQLVIQDTGIGIEAGDLPRIFEKGFTGYNGRNDKKSTGIGLYLCKTALDKLSHTIEVESEVGKGTKVKIGLKQASLQID